MTKKQNASAIRTEFDRVTADDNAWAIFKGSEPVAKVFIRYGGRSSPNGLTVRAFVHVLGLPMVRGISRGGGYDMKSAAVADAVARYNMKEALSEGCNAEQLEVIGAFASAPDSAHWDSHMRAAGFTVFQVI